MVQTPKKHQHSMRSADLGGKHSSSKSADALETLQPFGARVAKWFDDRKLTTNGTLTGQMKKLGEEYDELEESIASDHEVNEDEFKDAIGDMAVVLAGLAHMRGFTFEECLELAWNEIKDRTGHMNDEGIFVKD